MKKKLGMITLSIGLAFSINSSAFAAEKNELSNLTINYENDLGHKDRSKNEIVEELLQNGLSHEDAEYYANLDILVNKLEEEKIELNLDDVEQYSTQYVKANKKELRKRALNLDIKALKSVLSNNEALNQGPKDLQEVQDLMEEKYQDSVNLNNRTIEIKYADGSSLEFETSTVKEDTSDSVKTQATLLGGPWKESTNIDATNDTDSDGGTYRSTTTWRYSTGGGVASITDVLRWKFDGKSDLTMSVVSDEGSSSYAGIVTVDKEYLKNSKTGYDGNEHVAQGYTDILFKVSGSFSATYKGLGINVGGGAGWHQYAITEALRFDETKEGAFGVYHSAGQYL